MRVDLLIIDEMGKEISGEGIDPNVVGRDVCGYGAERPRPKITRIFVRHLTEASEGSAIGIGQADSPPGVWWARSIFKSPPSTA